MLQDQSTTVFLTEETDTHSKPFSGRPYLYFALLVLFFILLIKPTAPAWAVTCSTGEPIDITLPLGTRWEMCWSEDAHAGIELSDIYLTLPDTQRRRILRKASVAQIHEAFDNNAPAIHHVTEIGLGGARLQTLSSADCHSTELLRSDDRSVLCRRIVPRGLAYKYQSAVAIGDLLELYSVSRTGRSTFVVRWQFFDNGNIVPSVGASGQIKYYATNGNNGWRMNNKEVYAIGSTLNIFWRLDFALGNSATDDVAHWHESWSSSTRLSKAVFTGKILEESVHTVSSNRKRSWRITDGNIRNSDATDGRGHLISYHLEPFTTGHRYAGPSYEPWSLYDLFMTRRRNCERFATDNARVEPGCADNVVEFINGADIDGADIVFWYKVTRHRLPSNEDEPTRPLEWNQFTIYPRDFTPLNPLGYITPSTATADEGWS